MNSLSAIFSYNSNGAGHVLLIFGAIFAVVAVVTLIAWVKILTKAGYSGWWTLIVLVGLIPFLGALITFVMFLVFAFSEWPIERRLAMAEGRRGGGYGPVGSVLTGPAPGPNPGGYAHTPYPAAGYPAPGSYPPPGPTTPGQFIPRGAGASTDPPPFSGPGAYLPPAPAPEGGPPA